MWKQIRSVIVNDKSGRKESRKNMERGHELFQGTIWPSMTAEKKSMKTPRITRIWFWCVPNANNAYYHSLS